MTKKTGLFTALLWAAFSLASLSSFAQPGCNGNFISYSFLSYGWEGWAECSIYDDNGELVTVAGINSTGTLCLPDGCYTGYINSNGFNGGGGVDSLVAHFYTMNNQVFSGYLFPGMFQSSFEMILGDGCGPIYGCTDPTALNYNPEATDDDGTCNYLPEVAGQTCQDAIDMACNTPYSGSTAGVPNDNISSGVSVTPCGGSLGTAGQIWFSYTPAESGLVSVSTCGSMFDTYLRVYTGECGALTCHAYNDDGGVNCNGVPNGNALDSYITMNVTAGETYLIRVGGFGSQSGIFTVMVSCAEEIFGCADPLACNFVPNATDDGSCEYESCTGCTNQSALNYDPWATIDDGSCEYCDGPGSVAVNLYVCTFANGEQVGISIIDENGTVVYDNPSVDVAILNVELCMTDSMCYTAYMYNSAGLTGWYNGYFWINANGVQVINEELNPDLSEEAVVFSLDGSCVNISGCTDPEAVNYNPAANSDDGSCVYPTNCEGLNNVIAVMNLGAWASEASWTIFDANGDVVAESPGYISDFSQVSSGFCLADGCYTIVMEDSFGDGWNGGYLNIYGTGSLYFAGNLQYGSNSVGFFAINAEGCDTTLGFGCTDSTADNYDPAAFYNDGSCEYSGCMDAGAVNFDPQATIDDGSCEYCDGEGSVIASLYICTFSNGGNVVLEIVDDQGNVVISVDNLPSGAIQYFDICLSPGTCYTANMSNIAGPFGWYSGYFWINANGVQLINESLNQNTQYESVNFSIDGTCGPVFIYGCTDPFALNYNPEATINDGSCQYTVWGCTDPFAANYNANATEDDGSCLYAEDCEDNFVSFSFGGGWFAWEVSYEVFNEMGDVVFEGDSTGTAFACLPDGCYTVVMYDSFGDGWNGNSVTVTVNGAEVGSFELLSGSLGNGSFGLNSEGCVPAVPGCTDPAALNYNPLATEDNGTCFYPEDCPGTYVQLDIYTQMWGSEMSWTLTDSIGWVVAEGSGYSSWSYYSIPLCLGDGCYQLVLEDSWGDGWNGGYYMMYGDNFFAEGSLLYGDVAIDVFGINSACSDIAGCTDPEALNYNPAATFDDGSCIYNDFNGWNPGGMIPFDLELSLFPNPTDGGMILDAGNLNALAGITITITGLDGKIAESRVISNEEETRRLSLDVSHLSAGYYLMQVVNGDQSKVIPFVKQ